MWFEQPKNVSDTEPKINGLSDTIKITPKLKEFEGAKNRNRKQNKPKPSKNNTENIVNEITNKEITLKQFDIACLWCSLNFDNLPFFFQKKL